MEKFAVLNLSFIYEQESRGCQGHEVQLRKVKMESMRIISAVAIGERHSVALISTTIWRWRWPLPHRKSRWK